MFTNPQTIWIEVLVIVAVVLFLGFILGRHIYRKVKHLPTCECECHKSKKQLLKEYHKCCCKK